MTVLLDSENVYLVHRCDGCGVDRYGGFLFSRDRGMVADRPPKGWLKLPNGFHICPNCQRVQEERNTTSQPSKNPVAGA